MNNINKVKNLQVIKRLKYNTLKLENNLININCLRK